MHAGCADRSRLVSVMSWGIKNCKTHQTPPHRSPSVERTCPSGIITRSGRQIWSHALPMPPWCWEAELWKMEIVAFRVRCMVRYRVWSGARTVALTSCVTLLYLKVTRDVLRHHTMASYRWPPSLPTAEGHRTSHSHRPTTVTSACGTEAAGSCPACSRGGQPVRCG